MSLANKIVIIGGSLAGASVAARLRRLDEHAEIIVLDRSDVVSYAVCGIPYYLGGVIKDESRLQVNSQDEYSKLLNIDVRTRAEVFSINRQNKAVIVRDLNSGKIYEETFHKLVLAPGSVPNTYVFEGHKSEHIFTVRTREDGNAIKQYLEDYDCKRALIVGAELNGLETAENLHRLGITITILDESKQILSEWDPEMSALVQRRLWDKKVRVVLNDRIASVDHEDVVLASGKALKADIIILATGLSPNVLLAKECGLTVGPQGGISVNSGLLTSDDDIYALGDAIELCGNRLDASYMTPLAGAAYKQARVVSENLCGRHVSYVDPARNIIVKLFDMSVALAGASESQLRNKNVNFYKSYSESQSLPRYYPNTRSMIIKLLFASNTGCILGAQIVGGSGVDKRIDVIATAMQMGLSVDQLKDLNLCFAPPYSGVRDPVNVAGMVASNMRSEEYQVLHWSDVDKINLDTVTLIDVRTAKEFEQRTLQGAINIPLEELRGRLNDIPKDKLAIVFCNYGKIGYFAHNILRQHGVIDVYNISGGLTVFQSEKLSFSKQAVKEQGAVANSPVSLSDTSTSNSQAESVKQKNTIKSAKNKMSSDKLAVVDNVPLLDEVPVMENPIYSNPASADLLDDDLPVPESLPNSSLSSQDGIPVLDVGFATEVAPLERLEFEEVSSSLLPILSDEVVVPDVSVIDVDASGLNCPGPIMKLAKTMNKANVGDIVRIIATDSNFGMDIKTWCQKKGHRIVEYKDTRAKILAVLVKS